jgi:hypothetical protein
MIYQTTGSYGTLFYKTNKDASLATDWRAFKWDYAQAALGRRSWCAQVKTIFIKCRMTEYQSVTGTGALYLYSVSDVIIAIPNSISTWHLLFFIYKTTFNDETSLNSL